MFFFPIFLAVFTAARTSAMPNIATSEASAAVKPTKNNALAPTPTTFLLNAFVPKLAKTAGTRIVPFNGDFYLDGGPYGIFSTSFCPESAQIHAKCGPEIPQEEVFALANNGFSLNTSIMKDGNSLLQRIYIHYTGALRFYIPPQFTTQQNEPYGNFAIVKGTGGYNDTLQFTGFDSQGYNVPASPFFLCAYAAGTVKSRYPVYQVFVGTPLFHQSINTANCTEFVPQIHYSTGGAYEWL